MSAYKEHEERQMWQLLAEGSEYAFTQIFDRYRSKVYSVAVHFLKSSVLAEEIVQDVFMKIWLKRRDLAGVKNTEDYLFILARNLIFDRMKAQSYEATAQKNMTGTIPFVDDSDHRLRLNQCEDLLTEAVNQLPQRQQEVFRMAKMDGLSHEAIAGELQVSRLTVKKHMAEALKFIRKYLHRYLTFLSL